VYRIKAAVRRYTLYWSKRVSLFGKERAFLPLVFQNLTLNEQELVLAGHISIIQKKDQQQQRKKTNSSVCHETSNIYTEAVMEETRDFFYVDYGKYDKHTMSNLDFTRAMWYLFHCIIDDVATQKYGVIYLASTKTFQLKHLPKHDFLKIHSSYFKDCVPVRLSAFHTLYPPSICRMIFPIVSLLLNERIRKRILVHSDLKCNEQIIRRLKDKYGIPSSMVPTDMGGTYRLDMIRWTEQQKQDGK
jgi:CRAL/TRIO domain